MKKYLFRQRINGIRLFIFCLVLAGWLVLPIAAAAEAAAAVSAAEATALTALNADRIKNGLQPLAYNSELTMLAREYAADMIDRGFFSHNNPEGKTPFDRMRSHAITYRYAGENLAINDTVAAAQTAFMNSPTHRENALNPNFTEVGIGVQTAPNGKIFVVQEFIGQ